MENKGTKSEYTVTISSEEYEFLKEQITKQKTQIAKQESEIAERSAQIVDQEVRIAEQKAKIAEIEDQIAERNNQITENKARLIETEAKIAEKESKIAELTDQIAKIEKELALADEKLRLAISRMFGRKSEHIAVDADLGEQLALFANEPEMIQDTVKKAETVTIKSYKRSRQRSGSVLDIVPESTPVEIVEHKLEGEDLLCPKCGNEMEIIGKEVRRSLVIEPAKFKVREEYFYKYGCRKCKEEDIETPIKEAYREPALIPGGYASPEAVAYIMSQKYTMGIPLYRLEQELNRQNVLLSRGTMANWVIRCSDIYLRNIYEMLKTELLNEDIIHADETTIQVLHEQGRTAQQKSYMWLYMTGYTSQKQIALYDYKPSRSAENPKTYLKGYKGYIHTDGYSAYRAVAGAAVVGCWVHARREFSDAMKAMKKTKVKGSVAEQAFIKIDEILLLEKKYREAGYTPDEIYKRRLEEIRPLVDDLYSWISTVSVPSQSKTGIGLNYLINQKQYLMNVFKDGRLEFSNNRAERSIKPFVIGRKNWLFADTPSGAEASAIVYSIIETAKMSGLDPYRYLCYIFHNRSLINNFNQNARQKLMPWNAPDSCKA